MAALTRSGARKASEIIMLTFRTLQFSRLAMISVVAQSAHSVRQVLTAYTNGSNRPPLENKGKSSQCDYRTTPRAGRPMPITRLYFALGCAILILVAIGIGRSKAAEISVTKDQGENKDPAAPDWAKHVFFVRVEGVIEKGD
jgi:hypothetical protein